MRIGIIGAGNIGGNLTRRLTALGHDVSVANSRGPHTLTDLAEETGATPVHAGDAARGAEVVVVTIPLKAVPDLPSGLFDEAAEGVAVIDTNNYYPRQRDGRIAAIEDEGLTESRWIERQLGHPVVKAPSMARTPRTSWTATARPAHPTGWPSPSPATTRRPSGRSAP
ncbi:putative dinucleotide-binding enzyme [Streptomyces calvus]